MSGGNWYAVMEFNRPYTGVEISNDGAVLKIRIPFQDKWSAEFAMTEMRTSTEQENPVIPGALVAGEIEGPDDHDQQ